MAMRERDTNFRMALWARTAEGAVATAQQAWASQGLEMEVWTVKVLMVAVVVGMWVVLMAAGAMAAAM